MIKKYRNLNYIILRNRTTFDTFYRYFPIKTWLTQKEKIDQRILKLASYITRKLPEYPLIRAGINEKGKKINEENVFEYLHNLAPHDLAIYLGIKIY